MQLLQLYPAANSLFAGRSPTIIAPASHLSARQWRIIARWDGVKSTWLTALSSRAKFTAILAEGWPILNPVDSQGTVVWHGKDSKPESKLRRYHVKKQG